MGLPALVARHRPRGHNELGTMRLSVIIPVCGSSSQLALCLSALAASTRQPDDVIVVDDGSGDEAGAVSDLAKEHDARLVVLPMSRGPGGPERRCGVGDG